VVGGDEHHAVFEEYRAVEVAVAVPAGVAQHDEARSRAPAARDARIGRGDGREDALDLDLIVGQDKVADLVNGDKQVTLIYSDSTDKDFESEILALLGDSLLGIEDDGMEPLLVYGADDQPGAGEGVAFDE